ncbi:helix-turn-helix domain-containing protein [Alteromonas pelagimontana]|uniref:Helix-turn-helix domain-containing protein n=1 Tax=Alteromonas pelagimontana TaxID=1858656 RepID=A0A6M4MJJ2_9ALTE|nr:helix-turn-helix domain-containing protein [Alteromonas pelagimontana]
MNQQTDLLRPSQAAAYLNMHRVTLHRLSERDPNFPRKIKAGERLCYFRKTDLEAWLKDREV